MRRAAQIGDGWLTIAGHEQAEETVASFRALVSECGRDPESVAVEADVHLGVSIGGPILNVSQALEAVEAWRKAGANGVALDTVKMGLGSISDHLQLLREIAEALGLKGA